MCRKMNIIGLTEDYPVIWMRGQVWLLSVYAYYMPSGSTISMKRPTPACLFTW